DLFGANRRALEGLAAQVDYERFELDAARLSLIGNVVTTAVCQASLRKQIALTESLLADQDKQLDITRRRYDAGGVAQADVLSQRSQVAQTRASLAPLRAQLAQAEHQLSVYLGQPPAGFVPDAQALDLDALVLPTEISLAVPASLARRRPDIQASEALLHQASANVGVATANLYPQLTLTAAAGPGWHNRSFMEASCVPGSAPRRRPTRLRSRFISRPFCRDCSRSRTRCRRWSRMRWSSNRAIRRSMTLKTARTSPPDATPPERSVSWRSSTRSGSRCRPRSTGSRSKRSVSRIRLLCTSP